MFSAPDTLDNHLGSGRSSLHGNFVDVAGGVDVDVGNLSVGTWTADEMVDTCTSVLCSEDTSGTSTDGKTEHAT